MKWQPIETAPKDGTKFLACDYNTAQVCFFRDGVLMLSWNHERFSVSDHIDCDAMHWMPIPEIPAFEDVDVYASYLNKKGSSK